MEPKVELAIRLRELMKKARGWRAVRLAFLSLVVLAFLSAFLWVGEAGAWIVSISAFISCLVAVLLRNQLVDSLETSQKVLRVMGYSLLLAPVVRNVTEGMLQNLVIVAIVAIGSFYALAEMMIVTDPRVEFPK
jgi:hypothetical protein